MTVSYAQGVSHLYTKELIAGSNVTFDVTPTSITINAVGGGGGGGGAPTTASYVVMGLDAGLSSERVLSVASPITLSDSGPNGNATIGINQSLLSIGWTQITGTPTTLGGYGITDAVPQTRTISTISPLLGGGDLSADRTLSIAANGITNTLFRQSAGNSVVGRASNTTGDVADISASTDGHVLRLSGTTLGFGQIGASSITAGSLTYDRIQNVTNNRILGRNDTGNGPIQEISIGSGLTLSGGILSADTAPTNASYITVSAESGLSNERVATAGTGIVTTDGGTTFTISTTNNIRERVVGYTVDGNGSPISTGIKGFVEVPFSGTIVGYKLISDTTGSCVVDVWKAAAAVPTNADSITGTNKPTLSSAQRVSSTDVSGWTTAVSVNDCFGFEIESASTITRLTIEILVRLD